MPPRQPEKPARKRNRKRKRRVVSDSSSSEEDSSSSSEVPTSHKTPTSVQQPKPLEDGDESDLSSSSDESQDDLGSDEARADISMPSAKPGHSEPPPHRDSPSPPPNVNIPSFIPPNASESERALKEKFRKFWMASIAEGFKDDLEEIRKEPNLSPSRLALLVESLASGADVFSSSSANGRVNEMEVVLEQLP